MVAPPLLWLALATVLLLLAMVGADTDGLLLLAGLAALILAAVATLAPLVPVGQLLLFTVLVLLGYLGLRRWSAGRRERGIPPAAGSDLAEVISGFGPDGSGRVRWQGQSWAAVTLDPEVPLAPGTLVQVLGREGNRLQVLTGHGIHGGVSRGDAARPAGGLSRRTSD